MFRPLSPGVSLFGLRFASALSSRLLAGSRQPRIAIGKASNAPPEPGRSVRRSLRHVSPWPFLRQSRRAFPPRRPDARTEKVGVARLDLLPPRIQGAAPKRVGRRLYRTVLPRRAHGARGRPSPLLRVPPEGCAGFCRRFRRGDRARRRRAGDPGLDPGSGQRGPQLRAPDIDRVLHAERLVGRDKRRHRLAIDGLPDGAFLTLADEPGGAFAVRGSSLLRWTPSGYAGRRPRPRGMVADVLTPPGILAALSSGYRPRWHPSAESACVAFDDVLAARFVWACASAGTSCRPTRLAAREFFVAGLGGGLGFARGVDRQTILAVDQHDVVARAARKLDGAAVAGRTRIRGGLDVALPARFQRIADVFQRAPGGRRLQRERHRELDVFRPPLREVLVAPLFTRRQPPDPDRCHLLLGMLRQMGGVVVAAEAERFVSPNRSRSGLPARIGFAFCSSARQTAAGLLSSRNTLSSLPGEK